MSGVDILKITFFTAKKVQFGLLRTRIISVRFKQPKVFWGIRLDIFLPYFTRLESYQAI